ncbi:MAG: cation:proton antiporter [Proteobacteria bacterium]|nr:cation:proton antiporter [Pseudomonadota bacterium]
MIILYSILAIILFLIAAKVGSLISIRIGIPEVLGELLAGIVLGNIKYILPDSFSLLNQADLTALLHYLEIVSEIGVILLLFEVGLHSTIKDILNVGFSSVLVAVIGVVVPLLLGYAVSCYLLPNVHDLVHWFIGATLVATSVGITARVLKDINKVSSIEGRIILGAAVIDDVLGLIVLAIITGIIKATNSGGELAVMDIALIFVKSFSFLAISIVVGSFVVKKIFQYFPFLKEAKTLVPLTLSLCALFSYLAMYVGLAPIIGAFIAGLIIEPAHYQKDIEAENEKRLESMISPLLKIFVPVFFVLMGTKVDLQSFADFSVINLAVALTVVAIVGKQFCSLGVLEKNVDRIAVGFGMIPRGEVGLIFAGIGETLRINNEQIISNNVYSAILVMVVVTTLVTPLLIKFKMAERS